MLSCRGFFAVSLLILFAFCRPGHAQTTLSLAGTVRDFAYYNTTVSNYHYASDPAGTNTLILGHPDFEHYNGDDRNVVTTNLGADKKPVYAGAYGTAPTSTTTAPNPPKVTTTTNGGYYFNQWYNDVKGVNVSSNYNITLTETAAGSGIYKYTNNSFFPIDTQGFGNQGNASHNFSFTYELHTTFGYKAGTGQTFSYTGDDDIWVYVNDKRVIDLGGVHSPETASVNLDTIASPIGLTGNNNYKLAIFTAERHTTGSNIAITASGINLVTDANYNTPEPPTGLLFAGPALGVLFLGAFRRRPLLAVN